MDMNAVSRICGCTRETSPVPSAMTMVVATSSGCDHGFDHWLPVSRICGVAAIILSEAIAQTSDGIRQVIEQSGDPHYMPHRTLFMYAFARQESSDSLMAGVELTGVDSMDIVWDPCPRRARYFHGRMSTSLWALRQIQILAESRNDDTGGPVVSCI